MNVLTPLKLATTAAVTGMLAAGPAAAQELTESWRLSGFEMPESVLYDQANDRIIIGNMGAMAPDAGTDGYLSIVSPEGEIVEEQWTTGLMDPKGMAIVGNTLYVADTNGLVEIGLESGEIIDTIALEGAQFPNDVTAGDDGTIYVSDMMGDAIYSVEEGTAGPWLSDNENLTLPNGLYADGSTLWVGSLGENLDPETFETEVPGGLIRVDMESGEATRVEGAWGLGGVDGVTKIGDRVIFNINSSGDIYAWSEGGEATVIGNTGGGSADISSWDQRVLVPNFSGELIVTELSE